MLDDQNYEHHLQHIFILISFKQNYQFAAYPVKDKGCTSIYNITHSRFLLHFENIKKIVT